MTPSGIELATFQLAAQCLNQLRHQQRALLLHVNKRREESPILTVVNSVTVVSPTGSLGT